MNKLDDWSVEMRVYGGLGNQFFQYFAGTYFSRELHREYVIDFNWLAQKDSHSNSDIRDFKFFHSGEKSISNTRGHKKQLLENLATSASLRWNLLANFFAIDTTVGFLPIEKICNSRVKKFRGYYQTRYYFDQVQNTLRSPILELTDDLAMKTYSEIRNLQQDIIAVHVRGGDYLTKSRIYVALDANYYDEAIRIVLEKFPKCQVQVFSDDVNYARSLLHSIKNLIFFDDSGLRPSQVLQYMAASKALVMANSTFSFWAGLLGNSEAVISPKCWYIDRKNNLSYPKEWITI